MLYVAYENLTARWVDRVLYVSESERAAARSAGLWGRVPGEIIPNGVEPVADDQIECWRRGKRTELGLAEGQFVVATVSRFDAQKNMAAALEIAASLPDMIFLWIGDGPERAGLEQAARVRGIGNIRYLGFVDDPRAYLAAADAYLSTSFGEAGVPFAAIEAMCVGLLCVLSDVTGHRQHFPGEMGIYRFPLTDLNQCSTVLTSAKRQGVIEKTKISASIRHYQNATFSAETMALSIFEIYKKLPIATD